MKKHLSLLLLLIVIIVVSNSCGTKPPATQGTSTTSSNARFEEEILYYVNEHRKSKGLAPLSLSRVITTEAEKHSQQMASGRLPLGHDGFSTRIKHISDQLGGVGQSGENVAYGKLSAKQVVANWLTSPGHRENIEGRFNLTGIGTATSKKGVIYFTQLFIRK